MNKLIERHKKGTSLKTLAKECNVSITCIVNRFKKVGYDPSLTVFPKFDKLEYGRKWNKENKQYYRDNYQENREEIKIKKKEYDAKPENKLKKKAWSLENKDNIKKNNAKRYESKKEEIKADVKRYQKTPHGKAVMKAAGFRRKTILRTGKHSKLTAETLEQVYSNNLERFNGILTCELCFRPIKDDDSIDHKVPICRHEEFPDVDLNAVENLGVTHLSCNKQKHHLTLNEWFEVRSEINRPT